MREKKTGGLFQLLAQFMLASKNTGDKNACTHMDLDDTVSCLAGLICFLFQIHNDYMHLQPEFAS